MLRTSDDDGLRVVSLDRPGRRNALTPAALDDLGAAVADADAPVVYLRGAGSAFCAGADLDAVDGLADEDAARAFAARGQAALNRIEAADAVVVAGVDGPARGGGVELALACDLRVATPAASFAETGVRIGLFGAWGGTRRLPQVVGRGHAADLSLSGRTVDADEALRMGLVSRVVEEPRAVAEAVAANDPAALRALNRLLREGADHETQEDREAAAFARLVARRNGEAAASPD